MLFTPPSVNCKFDQSYKYQDKNDILEYSVAKNTS
jgi:hypothetical protein